MALSAKRSAVTTSAASVRRRILREARRTASTRGERREPRADRGPKCEGRSGVFLQAALQQNHEAVIAEIRENYRHADHLERLWFHGFRDLSFPIQPWEIVRSTASERLWVPRSALMRRKPLLMVSSEHFRCSASSLLLVVPSVTATSSRRSREGVKGQDSCPLTSSTFAMAELYRRAF